MTEAGEASPLSRDEFTVDGKVSRARVYVSGLGHYELRSNGERGATTLWEHWEYSDNVYSHNHPMFGSISGWFHKYLAGIRLSEDAVACNKIILQPAGFDLLSYARAQYHSPQGLISSSWQKKGDSLFY